MSAGSRASDRGYPEGAVFYRRLDRRFPVAVRAEGCWIETADGKRYLDGSGGALVASVGHGRREIAAAVAEAIATTGYLNGTQFTHRWVEELATKLVARMPGTLADGRAYFLASGSEAIEAAVKLARQVQLERGNERRWKVLSRVPSYHGNTLAALALSGREHYRELYGPLLVDFPRVAAPDPYRHPEAPRTTGEEIERAIAALAPELAAVLVEPIGGSTTGAVVPSLEYHRRLMAACRRHGVLVIADEIVTGVGRTGSWLASEATGLDPDVVVLGKGLNGGAVPLSALVVRHELVELLARGSGAFQHAQTYSHTPAITAAGLATLEIVERERLVERARALQPAFFGALAPLLESPIVGDIRGKGLLAAIELVADRGTKRPFARATRVAERVVAAAFERGLIVWPNVGHVDGTDGDLLMLAPPLVVSEAEIEEIALRLRAALDAVAQILG